MAKNMGACTEKHPNMWAGTHPGEKITSYDKETKTWTVVCLGCGISWQFQLSEVCRGCHGPLTEEQEKLSQEEDRAYCDRCQEDRKVMNAELPKVLNTRMVVKKCEGSDFCEAPGVELHTCPYKVEVNNDSASVCNCCDSCEGVCADEV